MWLTEGAQEKEKTFSMFETLCSDWLMSADTVWEQKEKTSRPTMTHSRRYLFDSTTVAGGVWPLCESVALIFAVFYV